MRLNPTDIVVTITQKKGVPLGNPREQNADCRNYEQIAEDIKNVLERIRIGSNEYYNSSNTVAIKCPYCGAPSIAYEGTTIKCDYCGMYLNA